LGGILSVKDLNFSFGSTKVLSDISFTVEIGDFIGLIGPNGSGKTTLLKLILGILAPQSGEIEILGSRADDFRQWSSIGYVPQKAANIDESFPANVEEVVSMGLLPTKRFPKSFGEKDHQIIKKALKTVDMLEYSTRRIGELSGGQQQRVFIARAIVSQPKILFLDEPTTGVDQKSQKKFYELLSELNKSGITIVLVSHDIGRITKYVTKIASLNQRMEFYGTHADFCAWDSRHHHKTEREHRICLHRG
jgi:zinc transport system ATP-binding protein